MRIHIKELILRSFLLLFTEREILSAAGLFVTIKYSVSDKICISSTISC